MVNYGLIKLSLFANLLAPSLAFDIDIGSHTSYFDKLPFNITYSSNYNNKNRRHSCSKPLSFDLVARHGARHTDHVQNLNDLATKIFKLSSDPPPFLKAYAYPAGEKQSGLLIPLGMSEHYQLGVSTMTEHISNYSPSDLNVMSTFKSRTGQSASSFFSGATSELTNDECLIPATTTVPLFVSNDQDNNVLRFFDECDYWNENVNENKDGLSEYYRYVNNSNEFQKALDSFLAMSGINGFNKLQFNSDDLFSGFEACTYDLILNNNTRNWCTLVSEDSVVDIINYANDLKMYYKYGPGHKINKNMAKPLLLDFVGSIENSIQRLENEEKGVIGNSGTLRFAHAETLVPFVSLLNVFNNEKTLLADERNHDRLFTLSRVAPFAGNVLFKLHDCEGMWYVDISYNGEDVGICDGEFDFDGLCNWESFKEKYEDLLNMDFEEICAI